MAKGKRSIQSPGTLFLWMFFTVTWSIGVRKRIQLKSSSGPLLLVLELLEKKNVAFYGKCFKNILPIIRLESPLSFLHAELEARDEEPRE